MRIVHVTDCYLPLMGGIETHVWRLSQAQVARGHKVTVFTATPERPGRGLTVPWDTDRSWRAWLSSNTMPPSPLNLPASSSDLQAPPGMREAPVSSSEAGASAVAQAGPRVVRTAWRNPFGLPFDPRAAGRFMRWLDAEMELRRAPDVVHLHLGELTPGVMGVARRLRRRGVPVVVSVHSVWQQATTVPLYRRLARITGVADAPFIWAPVSELVAGRVRQIVSAERVAVQPNGVDQEQWRMDPVPHEGLVAVAATRFAPRKRVPELLELLRRAGDQLGLNGPTDAASQQRSDTAPLRSHPDAAHPSLSSLAKGAALAMDPPAARCTAEPIGVGDSTSLRLPPGSEPEHQSRREAAGQPGVGFSTAPLRPQLRVVIAGEGPGLASARRFVASQGMSTWVKLPGRLTGQKLRDLYAHADVYLAPGVNDAFSVAGVEARAAGLAILSRAQSGFGADLEDGVEGCASDTDQGMTDALVRWTLDNANGGKKVQGIKEHNRTSLYRHSWDQVVPDTHALYRRAASLVA